MWKEEPKAGISGKRVKRSYARKVRMRVSELPFNKHIGIQDHDGVVSIGVKDFHMNHLGMVHANNEIVAIATFDWFIRKDN